MSGWEVVRNAFANVWTRIRNSSGSGGPTWFDELQNCEDGELLGISLGIDIVSGAVDESLVASALDYLPDGSDARLRFYEAVTRHPSSLRGISRLVPAAPQDVKYVRLLELGDFIYYYLRPQYGYTTDPSDVARVRQLFLRRPRPLGDITEAWAGPRGIVWVAHEDEVRSVMDAKSADDAAEEFVDRLGLALTGGVGPDNSCEMVAVTYPIDFERTYQQCHQPTAFDANWERPGTLYLSYGRKDDWGRTRSCSGQGRPMPERVHGVVQRISDSFVLVPVGVTMPPVTDRSTMQSEAYQRLVEAAG